MTETAQVAKLIRQELKTVFPSIKFRVTSSNFSMGNAVDVYYENAVPTEEIEAVTNKYEDGSFDEMTDCYEYKSNPLNLPRAKYIMVNRTISDENRQLIKLDIAKLYGIQNVNDEQEWWNTLDTSSSMAVSREANKRSF